MNIAALRQEYHLAVCQEIVRIQHGKNKDGGDIEYLNFADVASPASIDIAWGIVKRLLYEPSNAPLAFSASSRFEELTRLFLEKVFGRLLHIRPGAWVYSTHFPISGFEQYRHLATLKESAKKTADLATVLGTDYIITPDIVVSRQPVSDQEINRNELLIAPEDRIAIYTPLRQSNTSLPRPIFHASISCKWTLHSDRGRHARTEALRAYL